MHFRHLDLNLLVALDAMLTERHVTAAGARLHLGQSAMSAQLARLREYFEDDLLVQVGRKMVPTPLGESLIEPVRRILADIQTTIAAKPTFDPATATRRFTVMMSDYVASVLMTEVLMRAAEVAPGVSFELVNNNVPAPMDLLDRAEVDFLVMPTKFLAADHPTLPLFVDDYVCIACERHAAAADDMSLEQYLALGHVLVKFSRGHTADIDEWFLTEQGYARRVEVVAMNSNLVPQFVVGTRRIATVHRRIAKHFLKYYPLKLVELPLKIPPLTEALQWHRSSDRDPGGMWLRNLMKEAAQDLTNRGTPNVNSA